MADLSVRLGPLALQNPVLVAAGTFGYGLEFQDFIDLSKLGGLITKTLTLEPRAGNPAPRIVETPAGMLNAVGLQNIGISVFLKEKWPALAALNVPVIVSVAGFRQDEFVQLAERLSDIPAAAIELNLSCPNVSHGTGARCFSQNAQETAAVVSAVRARVKLPLIAKLTAEVADLPLIARAATEAGADALTLINTLAGMVIDVETQKPVLANGTGGLSGPALHPVAVRCVWETAQAVNTPIIGSGGISSGKDALEMILAGATAVSVGTANFWNPRASLVILRELQKLVEKKRKPLRELIGRVNR